MRAALSVVVLAISALEVEAELCLLQTFSSIAGGGKINESQGIELARGPLVARDLQHSSARSPSAGLLDAAILPDGAIAFGSNGATAIVSNGATAIGSNGATAIVSNASRVPQDSPFHLPGGGVHSEGVRSDWLQAVLSVVVFAISALVLSLAWAIQRRTSGEEHHFDGEEIDHIFKKVDVDGNGSLSFSEVKGYFKRSGRTVPDNHLRALIELADEDNSGNLDEDEFGILLSNLKGEGPMDVLRCLAAEWLGMFMFQFFGGMPDAGALGNNIIGVALTYTFAPISGAHINPCVTAAVYFANQIPLAKACWYVLVQMLAAIDGVLILRWLNIKQVSSETGRPVVPCLYSPAELPPSTVFVLELMCTFTCAMVFLGVVVDSKSGWGNVAPIVLGVSTFGVAQCCGPLSGVSMNPSRFLAPCIVYGCFPDWKTSLAYVFSSLVAARIAALVYMRTFMDRPAPELHEGMANFQFMVSDDRMIKTELAKHKQNVNQARQNAIYSSS